MSVDYNVADEKLERWKRSFFTIDNSVKPLAYKLRTEELKKTIAIYDKRKRVPYFMFVAVMWVAKSFKPSRFYRVLRFCVMRRAS